MAEKIVLLLCTQPIAVYCNKNDICFKAKDEFKFSKVERVISVQYGKDNRDWTFDDQKQVLFNPENP